MSEYIPYNIRLTNFWMHRGTRSNTILFIKTIWVQYVWKRMGKICVWVTPVTFTFDITSRKRLIQPHIWDDSWLLHQAFAREATVQQVTDDYIMDRACARLISSLEWQTQNLRQKSLWWKNKISYFSLGETWTLGLRFLLGSMFFHSSHEPLLHLPHHRRKISWYEFFKSVLWLLK